MKVTTLFVGLALAGEPLIYGTAVAGDGDSFRIGETRYRLSGIDAPEFDQTCTRGGDVWACGKVANDHLSMLITGRDVRCSRLRTDVYGRVLAKCTVNGTDVNRAMVASGYAVAFRRYSTEYVSAEDTARNNRRGLWSGTFEMPSEVRAASRRPVTTPREAPIISRLRQPSSKSCAMKGNHSRRGEWIYHVPGMPYDAQTRAEAVFCSEADARAAGYRKAKVR